MLVSVVGVDFQLMSVVCIVAVVGVVFILVGGVVPAVASAGCIVGVALSPKVKKKFAAPCTSLVLAK